MPDVTQLQYAQTGLGARHSGVAAVDECLKMALRLTAQTLARGVVARRLVAIRPQTVRQRGYFVQVPPSRHRAPLQLLSTRGESVTDAEVKVAEQLGTKLSMLDETLEALQAQLEVGEAGQEEDQYLLAQLVDEVKQEQEAWIEETKAMDKLIKEAANLDATEAELVAMTNQYNTMKRKVEMFTGLLQERTREVGDLRSQLQDIHQMGEVKELKQSMESKQMVATGSATAEVNMSVDSGPVPTFTQVPGFEGFGARRPPSSTEPQGLPALTLGVDDKADRKAEVMPKEKDDERMSVRGLLVKSGIKGTGMELPGMVMAAVVISASQLFSFLWKGAKQNMPSNLGTGVEAASVVGVTAAALSMSSKVIL